MSYSQEIKKEMCDGKLPCKHCAKALLYGIILFSRGISGQAGDNPAILTTENRNAASLFAHTIVDLTGAIVTVKDPDRAQFGNDTGNANGGNGKRLSYAVILEDEADAHILLRLFFPDGKIDRSKISPAFVRKECCAISFLRGAYLACGTMVNPEKEYHLEFGTSSEPLCDDLLELLDEYDLRFHKSFRGKSFLAYTKESNQIEDFLARLGAVKSSMELMNLKIEKELRNKVNRVTNCETANIDKTVTASLEQIRKIERIREKQGFLELPPPLREAAELRLNNPDASLRELSDLTGGKISRSGFNHRLQKLMELAEKLED